MLLFVVLVFGSGVVWLVVVEMFEFDWLFDWLCILVVLGLGFGVIFVFVLVGLLLLLWVKLV